MTIDPHVHCRDEEQREKATIAGVLELASSQGVDMIFDMPNPKRPVVDRYRVAERLALVPEGQKDRYRLFVGLTGDREQVLEALWCYDNIPEVIGLKKFSGKSVGDLSVIEPESQRMILGTLAEQQFQGVLADHCEKEALMRPDLWDPSDPISHTLARPPESEIESVGDQIRFALEVGYIGRLHICHASCPETVLLVHEAKKQGLRISCGVTPHHLLWDERRMLEPKGWMYKMNPPLRDHNSVVMMRHLLIRGMIDCIETDHAPHTAAEKKPPQCLSGFPSLKLYGRFVTEFLPGLGLTQEQIRALTRDNILEIFRDKL